MSSVLKRIDYLRRKYVQDLRDKIRGPFYTLDGVSFLVPAGSPPGERRSLAKGRYEAPERALVSKYLPADLPTIELGGCYGIVSNTIRRKLNSDVMQVVVEANPALISTCAYNLSQAGALDKTRLINAALGYSDDGQVTFVLGSGHHNSHVSKSAGAEAKTVTVGTVSVAGLAKTYIEGTAFNLVCDIEGAELALLRNEQSTLKHCQCLICEVHPDVFEAEGSSLDEVKSMIEQAGLEIVEQQENVIAAIRTSPKPAPKPNS